MIWVDGIVKLRVLARVLTTANDMSSYADLLDKIVYSDTENANQLLADLGLDGVPSPETIHEEIERNLLLPPKNFPDHWLPYYQT